MKYPERYLINFVDLYTQLCWQLPQLYDKSGSHQSLAVHGFGTSLTTQAVGKGKVILKSTYDGLACNFSVSNVLHIPSAHCNLLSGSRLDRKGVNTQTGKGKSLTSTPLTFLSPLGQS